MSHIHTNLISQTFTEYVLNTRPSLCQMFQGMKRVRFSAIIQKGNIRGIVSVDLGQGPLCPQTDWTGTMAPRANSSTAILWTRNPRSDFTWCWGQDSVYKGLWGLVAHTRLSPWRSLGLVIRVRVTTAAPELVCSDPSLVPWLNGKDKANAAFHKSKLIKLKGLHVYEVVSFLLLWN